MTLSIHHKSHTMMMTGSLAGAAKTMFLLMLSESVVLRVLLMLAEWESAKSTTTIDDKIVNEIRTNSEADGNCNSVVLFNAEPSSSPQCCLWLK